MRCSVLPEEPSEQGCRDRWPGRGSGMMNSFNYTLRRGCQCCGPAGLAQLPRAAGLPMPWGMPPRGTPWPHRTGASPGVGTAHSSISHPAQLEAAGGRSCASAQPAVPGTPGSPSCCQQVSPAPPRLASLAEGGAAAGGSRCHLHLTALGMGGSSMLPPGRGEPAGLVAEGWGVAGGDVHATGQPQGSACPAQGAGQPQRTLPGKSPAGSQTPRPWHTHGYGRSSTWHHAVGGDRAHGNGRQHRLWGETPCRHPAEPPPLWGRGTGRGKGEPGLCWGMGRPRATLRGAAGPGRAGGAGRVEGRVEGWVGSAGRVDGRVEGRVGSRAAGAAGLSPWEGLQRCEEGGPCAAQRLFGPPQPLAWSHCPGRLGQCSRDSGQGSPPHIPAHSSYSPRHPRSADLLRVPWEAEGFSVL